MNEYGAAPEDSSLPNPYGFLKEDIMSERRGWIAKPAGLLIVLLAFTTASSADEFKKGTYSATAGGVKWSIKYDESGKVTVSRDGEIVVEGTYKVSGDELQVKDEKGPMACGAEQTGKYKWKLEGKKLTLTKVEDECGGRASGLTAQAWTQE